MEYSDSHFIAITFVFLFWPSQTIRWSATIPVCLAIRNDGRYSPKHLEGLRLHISNWWISIKIFSLDDGIPDLCEGRLATGWKVSTIQTLTAKTFDPQQIPKSSTWQVKMPILSSFNSYNAGISYHTFTAVSMFLTPTPIGAVG